MSAAVQLRNTTSVVKSKFTEEFEKYLKAQALKATFNGSDIETFGWYKKMLGISY